jgi:hypothetical protein
MAKAADDCDDEGVMLFMIDTFPRRVRGGLFCMVLVVLVVVLVEGMGGQVVLIQLRRIRN